MGRIHTDEKYVKIKDVDYYDLNSIDSELPAPRGAGVTSFSCLSHEVAHKSLTARDNGLLTGIDFMVQSFPVSSLLTFDIEFD